MTDWFFGIVDALWRGLLAFYLAWLLSGNWVDVGW